MEKIQIPNSVDENPPSQQETGLNFGFPTSQPFRDSAFFFFEKKWQVNGNWMFFFFLVCFCWGDSLVLFVTGPKKDRNWALKRLRY